MAHGILDNKDFVSLKLGAWHGLGTVVETEMTVSEALKLGGLDFQVNKSPNVHRIPVEFSDPVEIISEDSFFTYRTDNNRVLGSHVGGYYTPLQNEEAFGMIDEVVQQGNLVIETAGSLWGGKTVFVCARQKNPIVVGKDDETYQYLVMSNSHDGSMAATAFFTGVRVVCNNTLNLSLKNCINKKSIKHFKNVKHSYNEALKMIGVIETNHTHATEAFNSLSKSKMTQRLFFDYLANVFFEPGERKRIKSGEPVKDVISTQKSKLIESVIDYSYTGVGQPEAGEMSAWWAYNGVAGYFSNIKEYKSPDRKMERVVWNEDANVNAKALHLALHPQEIETLSNPLAGFNLN